jgi:hypothetical protein
MMPYLLEFILFLLCWFILAYYGLSCCYWIGKDFYLLLSFVIQAQG